ncbi:hypothetical protein D3C81_1380370 [compost metagenome]
MRTLALLSAFIAVAADAAGLDAFRSHPLIARARGFLSEGEHGAQRYDGQAGGDPQGAADTFDGH